VGNVLDCPMEDNDADAKTVGEYLSKLLINLWTKEEGFDSKRPFGNSGWQYEVYKALYTNGIIEGEYDEEYDELEVNYDDVDAIITSAIKEFFNGR
jgi:hypothetical protein